MNIHKIKKLHITHINSFYCTIKSKDILDIKKSKNKLLIKLNKYYDCKKQGYTRWDNISPFDKDEIISIDIEMKNGKLKKLSIPYNNISKNGSYSINEYSNLIEDEESLAILWSNSKEDS